MVSFGINLNFNLDQGQFTAEFIGICPSLGVTFQSPSGRRLAAGSESFLIPAEFKSISIYSVLHRTKDLLQGPVDEPAHNSTRATRNLFFSLFVGHCVFQLQHFCFRPKRKFPQGFSLLWNLSCLLPAMDTGNLQAKEMLPH